MLFSSIVFLFLFLPVVLALYFLSTLGHKSLRNAVLLAASLLFYAWGEKAYVLILLVSITVNHFGGYAVHHMASKSRRSAVWALTGTVVFNLGLLGFFKYFNFVSENLLALYGGIAAHPEPRSFDVHLPIGISFFTFQAMSYVVDIYRGGC